jgi:hypothetical protein
MARKLDRPQPAAAPALDLPYRSASLAAIIRLISTFSSARFQRQVVDARALPDDPNALHAHRPRRCAALLAGDRQPRDREPRGAGARRARTAP